MASSGVKWVTWRCERLLGRPVPQRWIWASTMCIAIIFLDFRASYLKGPVGNTGDDPGHNDFGGGFAVTQRSVIKTTRTDIPTSCRAKARHPCLARGNTVVDA